jgi:hypothetical protein
MSGACLVTLSLVLALGSYMLQLEAVGLILLGLAASSVGSIHLISLAELIPHSYPGTCVTKRSRRSWGREIFIFLPTRMKPGTPISHPQVKHAALIAGRFRGIIRVLASHAALWAEYKPGVLVDP